MVEDNYEGLRCLHGSEVVEIDNFNHKCPRTRDAGLQLCVEVVGDVGDVDGQLMTHGVVVAVAVDDWYWR